jgi:hypothetical protein
VGGSTQVSTSASNLVNQLKVFTSHEPFFV